jgi:hypothetical protein
VESHMPGEEGSLQRQEDGNSDDEDAAFGGLGEWDDDREDEDEERFQPVGMGAAFRPLR